MKYPQLKLFADFLQKLAEDPDESPHYHLRNWTEISESNDPDNLHALHLRCTAKGLLRRVTQFFGCPDEELPLYYDMTLYASDSWHGNGEGNLRELADELIQIYEAYFDVGNTTASWIALSDKHNEF